jgi:hypothetical protein
MGFPGGHDLGHRGLLHVADHARDGVRAFPASGALGMGLIGTAGSLSTYFLLPEMGKIFDNAKIEAAGGEAAFRGALRRRPHDGARTGIDRVVRIVAFMPAILLIVFGLVWLNDRRKGGFKPERI